MAGDTPQRIKIEQHTVSGGLWIAAWLFTIGYLKSLSGKGCSRSLFGPMVSARILPPGPLRPSAEATPSGDRRVGSSGPLLRASLSSWRFGR